MNAAIIVLMLLLAGCIEPQPKTLYGTLSQWHGKTVQLAVDAWGDAKEAWNKDGVYTFVWIDTVKVGSRLYSCKKIVKADKAGNIISWAYEGHKEAGCF